MLRWSVRVRSTPPGIILSIVMAEITGLTSQEVAERQARGLTNRQDNQSSRSLGQILRGNILTPFNGLITLLAIAVMVANQSPVNSLFFVAMLLNIVVGVAQEVKAKMVLDKLAIAVKPSVKVVRDGKHVVIDTSEVVQDDIVVLGLGDSIVVDGQIVWSNGLEVDESLLTGESDPVSKVANDEVLSGSIVVAGGGAMRATKVGNESYSAKLAHEAKQFKRASSELIDATNTIMRWIARLLIIIVPILIIGQLRISDGDWREAIIHTVAAIVGMIPEGLVLLTSMAFLLAALKLARQKVLIQQLPAVETLARVNTLLLDKTGTITEGKIIAKEVVVLEGGDATQDILRTIANRGSSPTNRAILTGTVDSKILEIDDEIAFSSQRKWSAVGIKGKVYVLGAPEIVLKGANRGTLSRATELAGQGYRVLALAEMSEWPDGNLLMGKVKPLALAVLSEKIRPDAKKTLAYFKEQDVAVKIISGDSPRTVGAVAQQVGVEAKTFDARDLPDPNKAPAKFLKVVRDHNVFGRVKPEQKRQIAAALQQDGDVVAMTGDGVNDALALKKADLGIAMSSGSVATKAVAEVVLMDNKFSHLSSVLGEGRRVVANIERVASLFIIKNVYTTTLALVVTAFGLTYPFMPAQMTVIGALSIGIPAFFLALAPNSRRYQPGFLKRVLSLSIPTGLTIAMAMFACYYILTTRGLDLETAGTSVSAVTMVIVLSMLIRLSRPVKGWKLLLVIACACAFVVCVLWRPIASLLSFRFDFATLPVVAIIVVIAMTIALSLQAWLQHVFDRQMSAKS